MNSTLRARMLIRGKVLPHTETICVLGNKNRKPDDYLKVNIDVDKIHDILDKEKAEKEAKEKSQSE